MTGKGTSAPPPAERKKEIARRYSEEWKYWENVYDDGREGVTEGEGDGAHYQHRRDLILTFVDEFAKNRALRIIDVGCGAGALIAGLVQRGHSVIGIDISEKMAEVAQKAAEERSPGTAMCCVGDIESLPFCDGSFDVVIAAGVLSHQLDDLLSVRELRRIVRSDGVVVVTLPNRLKMKYLLDPYYHFLVAGRVLRRILFRKRNEMLASRYTLFIKTGSVAVRKYYYGQLNRLFRENGLQVRKTASCGFGPLTFFRKNFLDLDRWARFSSCLESLASRKLFSFLNVFPTFWVIVLDRFAPSDGSES